MSKTYKWQYRKHLLTLLCNYLGLKLRRKVFSGSRRFFYDIITYDEHELEVIEADNKKLVGTVLTNAYAFFFEREAINDLFNFLIRLVKVGKVTSYYTIEPMNWIKFTNEDDLKLQLVLAGAWKEMEVLD